MHVPWPQLFLRLWLRCSITPPPSEPSFRIQQPFSIIYKPPWVAWPEYFQCSSCKRICPLKETEWHNFHHAVVRKEIQALLDPCQEQIGHPSLTQGIKCGRCMLSRSCHFAELLKQGLLLPSHHWNEGDLLLQSTRCL